MKRAFIIHGWEGNPEEGWMPWLGDELKMQMWRVETPQMPHPMLPKLDEWLKALTDLVGEPDDDYYFIGHSLGCFTILKYLEQLKPGERVGGVVMVAGFAGNLKHNIPVLMSFYESGLDWKEVKSHCNKFVAIASERDDYVHIQSLHEFKEKLGAETIINNDWQHFSGLEGITELPIALESLLKISR